MGQFLEGGPGCFSLVATEIIFSGAETLALNNYFPNGELPQHPLLLAAVWGVIPTVCLISWIAHFDTRYSNHAAKTLKTPINAARSIRKIVGRGNQLD